MAKITKTTESLKFCEETIRLKHELEGGFIALGARLSRINDEKSWVGRWEDFEDFCTGGLKIERSVAYKLISIYQKFVVECGVAPARLATIGWSNLAIIVPVVNQKNVESWMDRASVLPRSEILKEKKEQETGIIMSTCKHKGAKQVIMMVCPDCGDRWRKYND